MKCENFACLDRWKQPVQWIGARRFFNPIMLPIAAASPVYPCTGCCRLLSRPSEVSQAKFSSHQGDQCWLFLFCSGSILFAHSGSILLTINKIILLCFALSSSHGHTTFQDLDKLIEVAYSRTTAFSTAISMHLSFSFYGFDPQFIQPFLYPPGHCCLFHLVPTLAILSTKSEGHVSLFSNNSKVIWTNSSSLSVKKKAKIMRGLPAFLLQRTCRPQR